MLCLLGAVSIPHAAALAEDSSMLEIRDTAGVTRNVSEVEIAADVSFSLEDASGMPAQGTEVTLTNEATGEVITAISANGTVTFPGVAPGVWVVASATPTVTFTSVTVVSAAAVAGTFGGTAILGMGVPTAIGVGAGALAITGGTIALIESDDDDDDDDVMSPIL